jgi:hyaluronan synthase
VWRLNPILAIHFFSLFALLLVYPIAVARALATAKFFPALVYHLEVIVFLGIIYLWTVRKLPKSERVGALAFAPLTLLMPVTYAMLTPLALFTLDTASWETRNHQEESEDIESEATATSGTPLLEVVAEISEPAVAPARARTASHAQLPAA